MSAAADLRRVALRLDRLPALFARAADRAVSTAARQGRALMVRTIRANTTLPAAYVQGKVFRRAAGKGAWEIGAPKQAGVPVIVYPHRRIPGGPRGKGWRVDLWVGDYVSFRRGFKSPSPKHVTKHGPLLFSRVGRAQYPIKADLGPSVSDWFTDLLPDVQPKIEDIARAELDRQLRYLDT